MDGTQLFVNFLTINFLCFVSQKGSDQNDF